MVYEHKTRFKTRRPGQLPVGKIITVVVLLTAVYFGIAYTPPFWRSWKVHSVLKDESSRAYRKRHQKEGWDEVVWDIERRVRKRLEAILEVPSEDLYVKAERKNKELRITAKWRTYAKYPLIKKRHRLRFKRTVVTALK